MLLPKQITAAGAPLLAAPVRLFSDPDIFSALTCETKVGERSGDMGQMLGQIARFHDDEVARFVDWFTRAFEPVLMAVLGVAIGFVVVLMYMPIFELAGNIK